MALTSKSTVLWIVLLSAFLVAHAIHLLCLEKVLGWPRSLLSYLSLPPLGFLLYTHSSGGVDQACPAVLPSVTAMPAVRAHPPLTDSKWDPAMLPQGHCYTAIWSGPATCGPQLMAGLLLLQIAGSGYSAPLSLGPRLSSWGFLLLCSQGGEERLCCCVTCVAFSF